MILDTIDEILTKIKKEAEIDKVVEDAMDSLLLLVCRSPSPVGGAVA